MFENTNIIAFTKEMKLVPDVKEGLSIKITDVNEVEITYTSTKADKETDKKVFKIDFFEFYTVQQAINVSRGAV